MAITQPDRERTDNLPATATRFIGRKRELSAIAAAIDAHRLVTLRGPGGVGKTRLALQVAAAQRDTFGQGAWLVELSAIRSPELLAPEVAKALGLPDVAPGDPDGAVARQLAESERLLVLDTCEHLVTACADLASALLAGCPDVRILATSREPLGIPGEQVMLISPLEVRAQPGQAGHPEAVELFLDRARAAVPGYALTAANAAAVIRLCQKLDGIPLALELAAVRLRAMSAAEIADRLDHRFRILGTARPLTDRHRTLRGAVDWSYELCTPAERRLWRRLSVFPGGFTGEAAEAVGGPGTTQTLARLGEKSIITPERHARPGAAGRHRMLDTMREYGVELLAEPDASGARRSHRDYYQRLALRAATEGTGPEQAGWMNWVQRETDNLRAALGYCFATPGEEAAGLAMTVAMRGYWLMLGAFGEGRRWHELAMTTCRGSSDNAWAVFGAGVLAAQQGALASARPLLEQAASLAAGLGDDMLAASVTDARAMVAFYQQDFATAVREGAAALAYYEQAGFPDAPALACYGRLASSCMMSMELDRAIELAERCARRCADLGEQWALGSAMWARGATRWMLGDFEAAIADALLCLTIKQPLGDLHRTTMGLDLVAVALATPGDAAQEHLIRAAELFGAGDVLWETLNAPQQMGPSYAEIRNGGAAKCRAALGADVFQAARRRGLAMSLAEAIAVARGECRPPAPSGPKPLTRREREIAALVADGMGNREIARQLFLSKRTVDSHLEHIFTKLNFTSRMQLADWVNTQQGAPRRLR